jgi:aspartyl-tRNA(Asn)/glutamyl-tRNA(Gln) amidotransferase subunit A
MDKTNLYNENIIQLSGTIRKGEMTSAELVESLLDRIESLDEKLNAFKLVCREKAMEHARSADRALKAGKDLGVLHGIPYAAKDLFDVEGLPTTAGAKILEGNIASQDAAVIKKLSEAGMILLGKTNTVQFAFSGVGINHDHGTPHNPWSQDHYLPGGSSSGSGVAVSAGMVPMALGTDTGGSVRAPASLCGTVGLKTTVGQVSRAGVYPLSWTHDSVGFLTRSVEDAASVYQCVQGPDINDDITLGRPPHNVLRTIKNGVKQTRLAFAESMFGEDLHPEVEKAVRECGRVFKELGAQVSSIEFPEAKEALELNPGGVTIAAEGYTINKKLLEEYFDELDPVVGQRMIRGKDVQASNYLENSFTAKRLRSEVYNTLKNIDVLIVPTTPVPAKPVTDLDTDLDNYLKGNALYLRNTSVGNILNLCGLSIPCGFTSEGFPIGLMIYGKPFQEDLILRTGYAFQQITDWHERTPDLSWVVDEEK